ncbi:hypothetical protein M569_06725 [Genlisea aurea]|uniref:MAR-binding filament-like protein 1 n=1 Tax=Genlisea aurea TaxID=192259 RepID=S8E6M5_9LAMI|nr:hypothetical protein M569_06725 [Genlisea aurea]
MAAITSVLFSSSSSGSLLSLTRSPGPRYLPSSASFSCLNRWNRFGQDRRVRIGVRASFSAGDENPLSKEPVIFNLIRDIEPLDTSLIQKDVSPITIDAMKRTISGILGLLPSDQFQVTIDALWEPLFKLLISSMTTGYACHKWYTLRNAEYRLGLERNLEIHVNRSKTEDFDAGSSDAEPREDMGGGMKNSVRDKLSTADEAGETRPRIQGFDEMTPEAQDYISDLQSRLLSLEKELHEVKRKSEALQMQQFVGEEKNDLLDYLRSLQPEKVAELSEPASPELKDTIRSVVHGLLATLSPKMHSKGSDPRESSSSIGTTSTEKTEEYVVEENTSLHFQPLISLPRDYLARLLFWCMLLGHYLRGLEYRLELSELLSLPCPNGNSNKRGF